MSRAPMWMVVDSNGKIVWIFKPELSKSECEKWIAKEDGEVLRKIPASIQFAKEVDGRVICENAAIPGAMAYGRTVLEALDRVMRIGAAEMREEREK